MHRYAFLASCAAVIALNSPVEAGDVVYVESNVATPNGNGIFAFRRDAEGALTMLPGSPFPTGGAGVSPSFHVGPYDSDQEIVVSADGSTLYAVNGGSDTIAVMKIKPDGSLAPIKGSPFPSGGSTPCSLGLVGHCMVVVNSAENPGLMDPPLPNYTVMQIQPSGGLKPVKKSTLYADIGSSPSQALIGPSNGLVFGAEFLGGTVRSLQLTATGRLIPLDAVPAPRRCSSGRMPRPRPCRWAWRSIPGSHTSMWASSRSTRWRSTSTRATGNSIS